MVALRTNDGRERNPTLADLNPPPPGPGIWERNPGNPLPPVLGLRLPGITPLALERASQFRPDGPNPLTSDEYAEDFNQVKELGRVDSAIRTPAQTAQALFWTDHDLRQWNDGMLRLITDRGLDLVQAARMLAMAHVAGGDGMIACFEAKYHYWLLASLSSNPASRHRRQPGHSGRPNMGAAAHDAELPRVRLGARFSQHRPDQSFGGVLRHRQDPLLSR
jgi:hypothetical protein